MKTVNTKTARYEGKIKENYLTSGKKYPVIGADTCLTGFFTVSDEGDEIFCLYKNCAHINDDWIVEDA